MAYVLVIDDDPDLLVLMDAHFTVRGHRVAVATSVEAALSVLAQGRPDVILLDFCLPKLDGARFIEILRADPLTKSVPVIVMSAAARSWVAAKLPKDPLVRSIEKPFDFHQLDPLVKECAGAVAPS